MCGIEFFVRMKDFTAAGDCFDGALVAALEKAKAKRLKI